jgi:acyl-CoA reductase-like NAD-dependent aldehyde dehydrogenase
MANLDYSDLVARQREYFLSGSTRPAAWRKAQLEAVKALFTENHDELCDALWKDLRRNVVDADLMDVAYNVKEADYALKHLDAWMEPQRVHTPLVLQPGHVRVRRDPLGVTLIIGAWNEPFMLLFAPLVAALAGGNTAVLKPSELAVACSAAAARLVPKYFDPRAVAVVEGAVAETTALLAQPWDFIFFTGSPQIGKIVHQAAAKHLTPCVLELGGKNPTIVHASANLKAAARRIAYGRYLNSGHICTAPDYVLVWPEVKDELVRRLAETIRDFYGDDPRQSPDYGRVINSRNFDRLVGLLGSGKIAVGGQTDPAERYIAPTVLVDVSPDSPIMQDEVFGPILPVLEIDSVEAVIEWVNRRPRPLGLYVFAEDLDVAERILDATSSGDAAVNDCTIHPLVPELPFGGVGNSGMGKYHGRWGFEAFTNARGVLYHGAAIDPGVRYPPYSKHVLERRIQAKFMP